MRLVGVLRVSRVAGREGPSFISTDVQRDQIASYARARGYEIVAWEEDLDQPGSTLNRPGLRRALELVDQGEADGIIAAKLDRLTRSIVDLGKLLELAREGDWNLIAVDVGLDLGVPNGKLVAHVLGAVAEWELDRRRADWQTARERAVARGVHVASRTPTGYQRQADGRLEPDPATGPLIHELFVRRGAGEGWRELANFLTAAGVVTPYGNETWTGGAASTLIRNRVYLGEARSGVYKLQDAHAALVTVSEWEEAQSAPIAIKPRVADRHMLTGLVRCSGCRYVLKADTMRDRDGGRLAMYRCRKTHAAGVCAAPVAILARALEPVVEERFLAWLAAGDHAARASVATDDLDAAVAELELAEAEVLAYLDSEAVSILGRDAFEHGLAARQGRVEEARERVRETRRRVPTLGVLTPGELLAAWPSLEREEQREVFRAALDAVVVLRHVSGRPVADRVRLVLRGEAPTDLPRRGRRVPLVGWDQVPADVGVAASEDL